MKLLSFPRLPVHSQPESLAKIVEHLEEEARMVLPGIQALFGFQLIAVFSQRFTELAAGAQRLHFVALCASAVSVLLILAPAAFHRQAEPDRVSARFCRIGTALLTISLLPLALGLSLDLYVIGTLLVPAAAAALGGGFFVLCLLAWFVVPQWFKL